MKRKPKATSPEEIRLAGMEALSRALGVAGMLRFMQQYEPDMATIRATGIA